MAKRKRKMKKHCPGSFRQQTPKVAERFIRKWGKVKDRASKQLITSAGQIRKGVGGLKTDHDANLAKIKFKQAQDILVHYAKRLTQYDEKLAKYKENLKQWRDCKAKKINLKDCGLKVEWLRRPAKPTGKPHAKKGCAGNFKTPSKHAAKAYLKRFFSQMSPDIRSFIPDASGAFAMLNSRRKVGTSGNFVPKIRLVLEVVGVAETAKIANEAAQGTLQRALDKANKLEKTLVKTDASLSTATAKAEKKRAKKLFVVKKRLETRKANLLKNKEKLDKYIYAVSMRKSRRLRRRRK